MKKVIYTQRVEVIENYQERRDCADQRISEFIEMCGYLPISVPNNSAIAKKIIDEIKPDGIILTGGNSLVKYGGNAPERDETDCVLIENAIKKRIPLYGFCRGMQSILDYFGNKLVNVNGHVGVKHVITGSKGTGKVNSYHNQACVALNTEELIAIMYSEDGVIEMIQHKYLPIIGTMWHPEREVPVNETDLNLVKTLIGE